MTFILRAAFWLAVVGAFLPQDQAPKLPDATSFAQMCVDRPEVCAVGEEAGRMARLAGRAAAERALEALADPETGAAKG